MQFQPNTFSFYADGRLDDKGKPVIDRRTIRMGPDTRERDALLSSDRALAAFRRGGCRQPEAPSHRRKVRS